MADLTITAGSVVPSAAAVTKTVTAGATITAGMPVYLDSADSDKAKPCDADAAATSTIYGIAANGASSGQPVEVVLSDTALAIGATVAVSELYVISGTAGGIAPNADLTSGQYFSVVGWGVSTSAIACNFSFSANSTGATHA